MKRNIKTDLQGLADDQLYNASIALENKDTAAAGADLEDANREFGYMLKHHPQLKSIESRYNELSKNATLGLMKLYVGEPARPRRSISAMINLLYNESKKY